MTYRRFRLTLAWRRVRYFFWTILLYVIFVSVLGELSALLGG